MKTTLTPEAQSKTLDLFKAGKTAREIAQEVGYGEQDVLLYLTGMGLWSKYCSTCVLKRCFDCKGLEEFGKPISIQDAIDLKASIKKNDAT